MSALSGEASLPRGDPHPDGQKFAGAHRARGGLAGGGTLCLRLRRGQSPSPESKRLPPSTLAPGPMPSAGRPTPGRPTSPAGKHRLHKDKRRCKETGEQAVRRSLVDLGLLQVASSCINARRPPIPSPQHGNQRRHNQSASNESVDQHANGDRKSKLQQILERQGHEC